MKKKNKNKSFETNAFYHYATEYRKYATDETEIEKINFTDTFWNELFLMIDKNELINLNINAPPTSGKSVTGMAIAQVIMDKKFKRKFNITDIDRDQQEFSKVMRNPDIKNTIRVIDEWNELETTGENASVEKASYNYFSDVMAQRFVHKISCSPKEDADKNALIYLEVISTDKVNKINHCKLFYKIFSGGYDIKQLIGHVSISVENILNKKWYQEYRRRKFEKMDLILKEGIFRPRVLEYAGIILNVVEKLKKLARMTNIINPNIVRNYVKIECKNNKVIQSIVGEELATREVLGVLDLYKSYHKIIKQISIIENKFKTNKIDIDEYKIQTGNLEDMKLEIANAWKVQEDELARYKEIHEKYNTVRNVSVVQKSNKDKDKKGLGKKRKRS